MDWSAERAAARARHVGRYDAAEVSVYDQTVAQLSPEDELAYWQDLAAVFDFPDGASVLDVGAGTGALSMILARHGSGLRLTALEPSAAMLKVLGDKPELARARAVLGYCDSAEDRRHFAAGEFDLIVSRQLVNGLFDPLMAFANWRHWLRPGGSVLVIDGIYGRAGWTGDWARDVDLLPLSACQTRAMIPYLLEAAGFHIRSVGWMEKTNGRPVTRTPRYLVVAAAS